MLLRNGYSKKKKKWILTGNIEKESKDEEKNR